MPKGAGEIADLIDNTIRALGVLSYSDAVLDLKDLESPEASRSKDAATEKRPRKNVTEINVPYRAFPHFVGHEKARRPFGKPRG
jgi:hypothetical protein